MAINDVNRAIEVLIGFDTEFDGPHTLTAQFAVRSTHGLRVQLYYTDDVPPPPPDFFRDPGCAADLLRACGQVFFTPPKRLTPDLSPAQVLLDLSGATGFAARPRPAEPPAVRTPAVELTLVGHHLPADLLRAFGAGFWRELAGTPERPGPRLAAVGRRLCLRDRGGGGRFRAPVVGDLAGRDGAPRPVRLQTLDTNLPFGPFKLDRLARAFAGVGKVGGLGEPDLRDMRRVFREKTADAYRYAAADAILVLLVAEAMQAADRDLFARFELGRYAPARMKPTVGARAAAVLTAAACRAAEGSAVLAGRGAVSAARVRERFRLGGAAALAARSRFGAQTGDVHGGLSFTRSPTRLFHHAPGQLRDVDLRGCYAAILQTMSVYLGRPVCLEPGDRNWTLDRADRFLEKHAADRDAWVVKVTGDIPSGWNALIPSTTDALTQANVRRKRAQAGRGRDRRHARLYSHRVEAGVVTWATLQVIRALPPRLRREYEGLRAETVLFYPAGLTAATAAEFDALTARLGHGGAGWEQELDLEGLTLTTRDRLGPESAALRLPAGELASRAAELRAEARRRDGRGSAAELAAKTYVNTFYGALACAHLPVQNVVAANVITATARAQAFVLHQALNGIQLVTDGCTYRRDQVPAGTFADLLAADPDYPARRPEGGGACLDPSAIPEDDGSFTDWYRGHARRFFEADDPGFAALLGVHALEHKAAGDGGPVAFDGLCCDGPTNYLKLAGGPGRWAVLDFKARGYGREAKEALRDWLVATYTADRYEGPPPVVLSSGLLGYAAARRAVRAELRDRPQHPLYFPLGLDEVRVRGYPVLRASTFVFRNPRQRRRVEKAFAALRERTRCGPELVALRRGYGARTGGSLADVAGRLFHFIREGHCDVAKALNLDRVDPADDRLVDFLRSHEAFKSITRMQLQTSLAARAATGLYADWAATETGIVSDGGGEAPN
jgi:hypothetical protein